MYILLSASGRAYFCKRYRDRNGRCIAILFENIGVRGRCDSPEIQRGLTAPKSQIAIAAIFHRSQSAENSTERARSFAWSSQNRIALAMEIRTFNAAFKFLCLRGAGHRSDFRPANCEKLNRDRKNRAISARSERGHACP